MLASVPQSFLPSVVKEKFLGTTRRTKTLKILPNFTLFQSPKTVLSPQGTLLALAGFVVAVHSEQNTDGFHFLL